MDDSINMVHRTNREQKSSSFLAYTTVESKWVWPPQHLSNYAPVHPEVKFRGPWSNVALRIEVESTPTITDRVYDD